MSNGSYEIVVLDAGSVSFRRTDGGMLSMESGGTLYPEVLLYRAFPLSRQDEYISVRDREGLEIGIIAGLSELDDISRKEVEKELKLRYLLPQVQQIVSIKQHSGMWVWHLQTSLGPIKLTMRNLHEHVQPIARKRLLLSDMDGNRCEIHDYTALDPQSRKQLMRVL